jgi:hypothetical protein
MNQLPNEIVDDIAQWIHTAEAAKEAQERCKMAAAENVEYAITCNEYRCEALRLSTELMDLEHEHAVLERFYGMTRRDLQTERLLTQGQANALNSLHEALCSERRDHTQTKRNTTRRINSLKRKLDQI